MLTGTVQLKALICSALIREGDPAGNPLPKRGRAFLNVDLQSGVCSAQHTRPNVQPMRRLPQRRVASLRHAPSRLAGSIQNHIKADMIRCLTPPAVPRPVVIR